MYASIKFAINPVSFISAPNPNRATPPMTQTTATVPNSSIDSFTSYTPFRYYTKVMMYSNKNLTTPIVAIDTPAMQTNPTNSAIISFIDIRGFCRSQGQYPLPPFNKMNSILLNVNYK